MLIIETYLKQITKKLQHYKLILMLETSEDMNQYTRFCQNNCVMESSFSMSEYDGKLNTLCPLQITMGFAFFGFT